MGAFAAFLIGFSIGVPFVYVVLHLFFNKPERNAQHEAVYNEIMADAGGAVFIDSEEGREYTLPAFEITRQEILDFITNAASDTQNYPVSTNIKLRSRPYFPDSLRCGERGFGLMFEKNGTIKLALRMDKDFADYLQSKYALCYKSLFPKGKDWQTILIDDSFKTKEEVFAILSSSYGYVLKKN